MDSTKQFETMIEDFRYIRQEIFHTGRPVSSAAFALSSEAASIHIFDGTLEGYKPVQKGKDFAEAVTIHDIKITQPKPTVAYITLIYEIYPKRDKVLLDAPTLAAFNTFDKEIGLIINEIN
jgi:hypothetical protein